MSEAQVHFTTPLGASVSVATTIDKVLECQRFLGARGWTSGSVPVGGHIFPYGNESDFDWTLIGARTFADQDGEICVEHRGHVYKRRAFDAVDTKKMKMPKAIKYSRGAKPTDPAEIVERGDGDFSYVTLCIFRHGRRNEAYRRPA